MKPGREDRIRVARMRVSGRSEAWPDTVEKGEQGRNGKDEESSPGGATENPAHLQAQDGMAFRAGQ